jgi:hypothetical protein
MPLNIGSVAQLNIAGHSFPFASHFSSLPSNSNIHLLSLIDISLPDPQPDVRISIKVS